MEYRMVFDSGSKALKCAIADENNTIISIESLVPEIIRSEDGFGRTCDPEHYWDNLLNLAESAVKKAKINPQDIRYLTSTAIRPSCVFCDKDFEPLYIGASFDIRGIDYGDEIEEKFVELSGDSLYQKTGHFPNFYMVPARLEWINNNPEAIGGKDIAHYFPIDSWILVKFGGEIHTNYSSAMESGFFDLENRLWLDEWYSIFDIDESFFPLTVGAGEIIGNVSKSIQKRLNLLPETEIVAGLPDTQAALFAVNAVTPGCISVVLGTTTPVQAVTEDLRIDPDGHTWSSGMVVKNICDNYIVEGSTGITGQPVKWAAHMFDSEQKEDIAEPSEKQYENIRERFGKFDEKEQSESEESIAEHSVYANVGPLPLATTSTSRLAGEFYFPSPSGVDEFYIHQNQLIGAVFDNIMFAVAKNIEYTKKIIKHEQISLFVVGGISRYSLLSQRISDLVNVPLKHFRKPEATIQGLLMLCDVASGKINTPKDLEKQLLESGDLYKMEPRSFMTNKLQKKLEKWLQIVDLDL